VKRARTNVALVNGVLVRHKSEIPPAREFLMTEKRRHFSGLSSRADLSEAIAIAIKRAKDSMSTDYIEWRLIDIFGKDGGFVVLHEIGVTIEVTSTH